MKTLFQSLKASFWDNRTWPGRLFFLMLALIVSPALIVFVVCEFVDRHTRKNPEVIRGESKPL